MSDADVKRCPCAHETYVRAQLRKHVTFCLVFVLKYMELKQKCKALRAAVSSLSLTAASLGQARQWARSAFSATSRSSSSGLTGFHNQ